MLKNTQNQLENLEETPKKRPLESSPTDSNSSDKENQRQKTIKMASTEQVTLEMILASINTMKNSVDYNSNVLNELKASVSKLESDVSNVNSALNSIKNDLALTKQEVDNIKKRLDVVENSQANRSISNPDSVASINELMQLQKATEMSIHNLPANFDKEYTISSISTWSGLKLDENSFKHSSLVTSKKGDKATLYLDFYDESKKFRLMKIAKACQRDINGKYIPILCENIFELPRNNKSIGVEVQFRNSMTNVNREIFNEAKKSKSLFCAVWLNRGNILVREKEDSKPIRLRSMEDLKEVIKQHKKPEN